MCSFFSCCAPLIRHEYFYTECKHHAAKSNPAIFHTSLCGMVTNNSLQNSIRFSSVTTQLAFVSGKNKIMKETILDSKSRSKRDSLTFNGVPESPTDEPEKAVKDFMIKHCKLPTEAFQHVHHLGQNTPLDRGHLLSNLNISNRKNWYSSKADSWKEWTMDSVSSIHKKSSTDTNSSFPSTNTW